MRMNCGLPQIIKMLAREPGDEGKQGDFQAGKCGEQMHFWYDRMVAGRVG